MAQKVLTILTDDLDGKELKKGQGETVTFGLDGQNYEIDLSQKNADQLRAAFSTYIQAGRKVSNRTNKSSRSTRRTQVGPSSKEIRDWARSNGLEVPERGRIPGSVREAFEAAR